MEIESSPLPKPCHTSPSHPANALAKHLALHSLWHPFHEGQRSSKALLFHYLSQSLWLCPNSGRAFNVITWRGGGLDHFKINIFSPYWTISDILASFHACWEGFHNILVENVQVREKTPPLRGRHGNEIPSRPNLKPVFFHRSFQMMLWESGEDRLKSLRDKNKFTARLFFF